MTDAAQGGGPQLILLTANNGDTVAINAAQVCTIVPLYEDKDASSIIILTADKVHVRGTVRDLANQIWPERTYDHIAPENTGPPYTCEHCSSPLDDDIKKGTRCACGNIWLGPGIKRYANDIFGPTAHDTTRPLHGTVNRPTIVPG